MKHTDMLADLSVLSMMNTLCSLYSSALVHCYRDQWSKNVYPNHSPYSKSENIILITDVFITGGCNHILEIRDMISLRSIIS